MEGWFKVKRTALAVALIAGVVQATNVYAVGGERQEGDREKTEEAESDKPKLPLVAVPADSVVIEDFFWDLQFKTVRSLYPEMRSSGFKDLPKANRKLKEEWERDYERLLPTGVLEGDEDEAASALEMAKKSFALALATGETKYFAAMEHCLYNGVAGRMADFGGEHIEEVAQMLTDLPGMIFATSGTDVYINMFVRNTAYVDNGTLDVMFVSTVSDPWFNEYLLQMKFMGGEHHMKLHLRLPEWEKDSVLPCADYDRRKSRYTLTVSGNLVTPKVEDGYVVVEREWTDSDFVVLRLPTSIMRVALKKDPGNLMIQKGSLLYTFVNIPESCGIDKSDAIHSEFDKDRHTNVLSAPCYNEEGVVCGEYRAEPYAFNRLNPLARLSVPVRVKKKEE